MAGTHQQLLDHIVFSTKNHRLISPLDITMKLSPLC
jgi:hypothetical protein